MSMVKIPMSALQNDSIVNTWVKYDNSGTQPELFEWGENP